MRRGPEQRAECGEMGVRIGEAVERVNGKELRYSEFVERYLKGNRPVVLTGLMDGWRACRDWVTKDGRPNLSFFSADPFAKSIVQVADCDKREFTDQKRMEMSVSEFIKHWLGLPAEKCGGDIDCNNVTHSLLYLKDWHFNKEHPGYMAYTTPAFFSDDWLNIYLDSHHVHQDSGKHQNRKDVNCADYRFVYMGEKGTWTPLHADVFRSYSWSANVCGKKYWLLLPPSQCHLAFDRNLKTSVYDVYGEVSEAHFPGFKKTVWWECTQEHNEIIFVPSGWYHQVHNLEDTISINHNWFNGYNLSWVWNLLLKDYNEAKAYIEDIREICDNFESLCQRNLAANTGMNFYDFFIFVRRFALANLTVLYYLSEVDGFVSEPSNRALQLTRNLLSIRRVVSSMDSAEAFTEENIISYSEENQTSFSEPGSDLVEPEFLDLSAALLTTYGTVEGREHVHLSTAKDLLSCLNGWPQDLDITSGPRIRSPKDLVILINRVISEHCYIRNICNFVLPSDDVCHCETRTI